MNNKSKFTILAVASLLLLISCGKSGDSSPSAQLRQEETEAVKLEGHYMAKFITLNPQVNGTLPGSASFYVEEDKLTAYLRLFAGGPQAWHRQALYSGSRCPTIADDTNGDGFIDVLEGEKVWGKIILPLDADISTQKAGQNFYPVGDLSGSYYYERFASLPRVLKDLRSEDPNPEDEIMKIGPNEPFNFEKKVVVVQGVVQSVSLPATVATSGRRLAFQTLPITCGVIWKVTWENGTVDDGNIPGPIAEVEEGQDVPSNEELPPDTSTGSPAGTGNNRSGNGETPTSDGGEAIEEEEPII